MALLVPVMVFIAVRSPGPGSNPGACIAVSCHVALVSCHLEVSSTSLILHGFDSCEELFYRVL